MTSLLLLLSLLFYYHLKRGYQNAGCGSSVSSFTNIVLGTCLPSTATTSTKVTSCAGSTYTTTLYSTSNACTGAFTTQSNPVVTSCSTTSSLTSSTYDNTQLYSVKKKKHIHFFLLYY